MIQANRKTLSIRSHIIEGRKKRRAFFMPVFSSRREGVQQAQA